MLNTILLIIALQKPQFNPKGYCSKYCPSGPRRAPVSYYCCDKDHLIIHPDNIFDAASHPNEDWIKYYIDKGEYINQINEKQFSYTPLHYAALNKNIEVAKQLLQNGADINAMGDNKVHPIHLASINNNLEFIKLLLKYGANINVKDDKNRIPLHLATIEKNCKIVDYLLENGADYYAKFYVSSSQFSSYYNSYEYTYNRIPASGCLKEIEKHDPLDKWLVNNNFELSEYKTIIDRLGIYKLSDVNKFKGIKKNDLFAPIEWSLNYYWIPTAFPCTPNCTQHKINLFRLINN